MKKYEKPFLKICDYIYDSAIAVEVSTSGGTNWEPENPDLED